MQIRPNRRRFLAGLAAAGAAGLLGPRRALADEAPPEATTIRLAKIPGICIAPQYVEELLRVEGFNELRYVPTQSGDRAGDQDRARRDRLQHELCRARS